jgi:hypothetical protein
LRCLYPIERPQVSCRVRSVYAKGRWWDVEQQAWRDGRGRKVPSPGLAWDVSVRTTRVVLAAAVSTTTQRIVDTGTATSGRSASGATCCMTGRSTGGAD